MTSPLHPLFGQALAASGFKRWEKNLLLVVALPDGSPGTIPAEATDILGTRPVETMTSVLSVEGVRHLRRLLDTLGPVERSPKGTQTRK